MGVEVSSLENEADQILADSVNSFFPKEKEEVKEEVVKEAIEEKEIEEVEETDSEEESEETEDETTEEVEEETEIEEKEINLADDLRGVFSKDHINLLDSIEDPDLRSKFIEEGKKSRSELDRKRLELGEGKKALEQDKLLYANFKSLDDLSKRDPKLALEGLAKHFNVDLNTLGTKPVQEDISDDDYRTPEEIKRDQKFATLEQEINLLKNQRQQQEQVSVQQEINDFANTKDTDGSLKYPHFEKVKSDMGLFFNNANPDMTMDKAYKKAIRLDDELSSQRDADILKKDAVKRKADIVKAKQQKKQSVRSSKVTSTAKDPGKALENIVNDFYGS